MTKTYKKEENIKNRENEGKKKRRKRKERDKNVKITEENVKNDGIRKKQRKM